jgi:hypothetical protein
VEIRRIIIPGQPGQKKFLKTILYRKKLSVVAHACHPLMARSMNKRVMV